MKIYTVCPENDYPLALFQHLEEAIEYVQEEFGIIEMFFSSLQDISIEIISEKQKFLIMEYDV